MKIPLDIPETLCYTTIRKNEREENKMMMFVIGFVAAWLLLGIFFYVRSDVGGWSIFSTSWDTILVVLPAFPIILLVEIVEEKILKK